MKKSSKRMKKILKIQAEARRKLDGIDDTACNDMNLSNSDSNIINNDSSTAKLPDKRSTNKSDKQKGKKSVSTVKKKSSSKKRKRVYKYGVDDFPSGEEKQDTNVAESRKVHKKICRVQRRVVAESFEKRILSSQQKKAFHAIGGTHKRYCADMLASDIRLRELLGYAVIDEMAELHRLSQLDDKLSVYLITPLSDKFQYPIRGEFVDIKACIDKFTAQLRQHTNFNAFGVVETQVILGEEGSYD